MAASERSRPSLFWPLAAIVITLGMMFILQGVMLEIMGNKWLFNLSDTLTNLGRGSVGLATSTV